MPPKIHVVVCLVHYVNTLKQDLDGTWAYQDILPVQ